MGCCTPSQRSNNKGQATVEAAVTLPILMLLTLLLLQPGILLYDRLIMSSAAAEGCRLLATNEGEADEIDSFLRRRLGAVPEQDNFHVHSTGCTWDIQYSGGGASDRARVTLRTEVRPIPLIGAGSSLLGLVNARGNFVVEVTCEAPTRAVWAQESLGGVSPHEAAGAWLP